ncbi:TrmH family RNA methyltransferase, partial [Escherichia coli]|uniref:TrmH family RNA methyltransferase n=1 Tax=Escherichia coli TaxID=562 RepID=UPI0025A668C5
LRPAFQKGLKSVSGPKFILPAIDGSTVKQKLFLVALLVLAVALVFGRERVGLTNEELQKCHYHVAIAANPEYSSLNLAMAVQVIAYEVRMAWLATQENGEQVEHEETPYPLVDDLERFYGHLEQTLLATGFIRENHPGQVMNKLRRLFTRARPESQELNILRGILASIEQQNKGNKAE